ncbi:hypothetical protein WN51_06690 [Melipona quadrifasciata]|uniref:Uncharacterized protein n=1 Tax=Melipona quadrifasciata TaxID=166423 RepID=A0A0N0U7D7_9HYME|nr:hypothetical protein WN51_06690 [Melipona quadrifasciata]
MKLHPDIAIFAVIDRELSEIFRRASLRADKKVVKRGRGIGNFADRSMGTQKFPTKDLYIRRRYLYIDR